MKKDHAVLDFVKIPFAHKIEFGRNVIGKIRGNINFPTPDVPVEEIKSKTDTLETRYVASLSGGKQETALLYQADEDWIDIMRKTARYVDRIADGDGAMILSAGFNLAKQPAPSVRPEFSVELGEKSGTVFLRRQKVEGARSYIWQTYVGESPDNESEWKTALVTSQASTELVGLTPLTKCWFRVAAVTIEGTEAFSLPIMQIVI